MSAFEQQIAAMMQRIEAAMVAQSTAINQQPAAAAATDARLATGETNVQAVVTALETRLAENERKLADALTAVSGAIVNVQQRIADSKL